MVAFEKWKREVDVAVLMLCGTTEALSTYHYLEAWQAGYSPEHAAVEALAS